MSYIIQSSEKTRAKCSEFETKALLYLMTQRDDSENIFYFSIDFFNDLTGLDRQSNVAWDVQSKAAKNNFQSAIGKELVTLFKNYISPIKFDYLVLFLGGVADSIRIDKSKNIFKIENITKPSVIKIRKSLIKESKSKTYIDDEKITDSNIDQFLEEVVFVIDSYSISDYIKKVIKVSPQIIPDDDELENIFNQIRDAQSSKKNYGNVEGRELDSIKDFIYYGRHLTSSEIKLMVLNLIINSNLMERGMPQSFTDVFVRFDPPERKNMIEDCQHDVALTLFDKNNADNFWEVFSDMYKAIVENPSETIDNIYNLLDSELLEKVVHLNLLSTKYFLALIKDGIHDN